MIELDGQCECSFRGHQHTGDGLILCLALDAHGAIQRAHLWYLVQEI